MGLPSVPNQFRKGLRDGQRYSFVILSAGIADSDATQVSFTLIL